MHAHRSVNQIKGWFLFKEREAGRSRSTGWRTSEEDTEMPLSPCTVCDGGRVYAMEQSARFESLQSGSSGEYTSTDCFIKLLNQKLLAMSFFFGY